MAIDVALLGGFITLLLAVLAGGFYLGRLSEKVRNNRFDIEDAKEREKEYRKENREEHLTIMTLIRNGNVQ